MMTGTATPWALSAGGTTIDYAIVRKRRAGNRRWCLRNSDHPLRFTKAHADTLPVRERLVIARGAVGTLVASTGGMTNTWLAKLRVSVGLVIFAAHTVGCAAESTDDAQGQQSLSADECVAAGGEVRNNPGAGVSCAADEEEIGKVPSGIEGGICCKAPAVPTMSVDECKAAGGEVRINPGAGISCATDEERIGKVPFGIEGAICCK